MLSVGIDTHESMHQAEVLNQNGKIMWSGRIRNNREGLQELVDKILQIQRSNSDKVAGIFMNPTGNFHLPVKYFLEKNGFQGVVYLVDPRVSKHMRMINNLGSEKSDPEDAHILASTLWEDRHYAERKGHSRDPLSEITRLRSIVNVNITRIKNLIWADLAAVFPEFGTMFALESKTALVILEKYPLPQDILNLGTGYLASFLSRHSMGHYSNKEASKLTEIARLSIGIPDEQRVYALRIQTNVKRLKQEMETLEKLDREIEMRSSSNTLMGYVSDIRGMGIVNSASIVSEIGRIDQFGTALKLQSYGGKCPDMTGSGGKNYAIRVTRIRNSYLSDSVFESAVSLVNHHSREFEDLYRRSIKKGKTSKEAYIVVGKRLLYHIFTIMKNNKPYRERISRGRW